MTSQDDYDTPWKDFRDAYQQVDDGRLASGSADRTIQSWQLRDGHWTEAVRFVADAAIETLAFGAGAGILVAGDESGRVHLLKVEAAN